MDEHLTVRPLSADDLPAVHEIYSDPATWRHLPSGRHATAAPTRSMIARAEQSWRSHGLGPWTVLLDGVIAGTGGVSVQHLIGETADAWNLGYRLAPWAAGRGIATRVAALGLGAAHATGHDLPVVARVLLGNPASIRVLDKVGLVERWQGPTSEGEGTRALARVIHADRELDPGLLRELIALG